MKMHPPRTRTAGPEAEPSAPASAAAPRRREAGTPSGWDRYLRLLEEERIPESARRWYVVRAQAFVEAMRPKRLGELSVEEIKAFFPCYAREQRLSDWQYRHTVEAVRLLLLRLGAVGRRARWSGTAWPRWARRSRRTTRPGWGR